MTSKNGIIYRAEELCEAGFTFDQALTQMYTDFQANGVTRRTINDFAQYASVEEYENTSLDVEKIHIMTYGASRTVLAETTDMYHYSKKFYLVSEFGRNSGISYVDAQSGEETVALVSVTGGSMNGPTIRLDSTTECTYSSLSEFVDAEYRNADFTTYEEAKRYYTLLIDAGIDEDNIPKPGDFLHPSNPDSSEHINYQLRSLEAKEPRRPNRH